MTATASTDPVALLERLIRCDTHNPGGDELAMARLLADELSRRGPDDVQVIEVPRADGVTKGAYVWARWGTPRWMINTHLDTVPVNAGWTGDPFVARVGGGRVMGLGAADTKGAIAAALCALDVAKPKHLAILYSGDEEHGGTVVRAFLETPLAKGIERAIVCEPTSCRAGTKHRGILAFDATLRGEGGHSSRADSLPAPVGELAKLAVAVYAWGKLRKDQGPAGFPGMCMNVAKLAGGVAFNVVPDEATLSFSLRPPPGLDAAGIRKELEEMAARVIPGITMRAALSNPTFATRDLAAFRPALGAVVDAPIDMGFWTEAAVLAAAGIDAVVFGPGDIALAHAPDEWVPIADLHAACDAFVAMFRDACG